MAQFHSYSVNKNPVIWATVTSEIKDPGILIQKKKNLWCCICVKGLWLYFLSQDNGPSWQNRAGVTSPRAGWGWRDHLPIPDSLHDNLPIFQNILCMQTRVLSIYISDICCIVWASSSWARRCDLPPEQNEVCRPEIKRYVGLAENRVDGGKQ